MAEHVFRVETEWLDLPALAGAFSRRLHDAGVSSGPDRSAAFAHALRLVRPVSRRRLYCTARAVFVSDSSQLRAFDQVFSDVFGGRGEPSLRQDPAPSDSITAVPHRPTIAPPPSATAVPVRKAPRL